MDTISYTSARSNLAKTMDKVCKDHSPVVITRVNAKPVVLMSLEDFESVEETHYLMKNPTNAARLIDSINEIESMINQQSID